jgi:hypothetical protein
MPASDIDVLLCYRGRFRNQVSRLDELLTARGLSVTYDAEILQPGVEYGDAEIEWISLGQDDTGAETSWRGPLSSAVKRSELIVFLVDTQDPSVNVMNEIAWTARSGKPLFVVFNTTGTGHSADWEAIQVSMIHINYSMATGQPESPRFGYHFVTHESDAGLDERLTILANRILSYLEQVRGGDTPMLRVDSDVTLSDIENLPAARARRRLHAVQEQIAKAVGMTEPLAPGDPLQAALAIAHERERDGVVRDGMIHRRSAPFSFAEGSERERYRRTEALLETIRPGPFENPHFIEILARELVSIEMVLEQPMQRAVLIGTAMMTPSDASCDVMIEPDHAVLLVDIGLMDFGYQMLKVAVMSWKITSPPGVLPVTMSTRLEDTRAVIASNPELVTGFARCLGQFLRDGAPGSTTAGMPPPQYRPALLTLSVFQKRFTVVVALGRMLALDMMRGETARKDAQETMEPPDWVMLADALAARWVFASAQQLDRVDATIAYQGISLMLKSHEILESSLCGYRSPEIVSAASRSRYLDSLFADYLTAMGKRNAEVQEQLDSARDLVATFDVLRQAAIDSGEFELGGVVAPRWQRHMTEQTGT